MVKKRTTALLLAGALGLGMFPVTAQMIYAQEPGMIEEETSYEELYGYQENVTLKTAGQGDVVVVLDPGHDESHTGAYRNGIQEETVTLKIAQYCKEELSTYAGVAVYLTRETAECPHSGSTSTDDNIKRVQYARDLGADAYISLHLNSADSSAAKGVEVYYPNQSYDKEIGNQGKALAQNVLDQLTALGLTNRGIKIQNASDGTYYYADGTTGKHGEEGSLGIADSLIAIKYSKVYGFPGILVEHAFVSNSSDVQNYLSTEAQLKKLGVADATGIAEYFGLSKKPERTLVKDEETGQWICYKDGKPDNTYTGVMECEKGWIYIKNGVSDFTYNGVSICDTGSWKLKNGIADLSYEGFAADEKGDWYYLYEGKVQFGKNDIIEGIVNGTEGWWYITDGQVSFTDTVAKNAHGWWYVHNGMVDFSHYGVEKNSNGWWRIEAGKVNFDYEGFAENKNGWWYLTGGKVQFAVNDVILGIVNEEEAWWYVKDGQVKLDAQTVARNKNGWWYIENGRVDFGHYGVEKNSNGWWRIEAGKVNFDYEGFAENKNGWWYLTGGKVQFAVNDVILGVVNEEEAWWYVKDGQVKLDAQTVARNKNGWWYIENGRVDFGHYGVEMNGNGWWRIEAGKVNFDYEGFAENKNGWWYLTGGKVQFAVNDVILGIVNEEEAWWYVKDGQVKLDAQTVARNRNGWWYIENGKVNFDFNGIAENENGWWVIESGKVNFNYNGTITEGESTYSVCNGKVDK